MKVSLKFFAREQTDWFNETPIRFTRNDKISKSLLHHQMPAKLCFIINYLPATSEP
jgi:hypothetical protein